MTPTIKIVAKNGQISLPPKYRGLQVALTETERGIMIQPLFWDEDLGIFLHPDDHEETEGKTVWKDQKGINMKNLGKALSSAEENDQ